MGQAHNVGARAARYVTLVPGPGGAGPTLGFSVNEVPIVGEHHEVQRSLRAMQQQEEIEDV